MSRPPVLLCNCPWRCLLLCIAGSLAALLSVVPMCTLASTHIFQAEERVVQPLTAIARPGSPTPCIFAAMPDPLPVAEAVERMLCNDPNVRLAWAQTRAQAAQVGLKQSAYLPRLNAQLDARQTDSEIQRESGNSGGGRQTYTGAVNLLWVVLDFGAREAALETARQLLRAANASGQAAVQQAFLRSVQLYYQAQSLQERLQAARQVLDLADENHQAANAKYQVGAAALSDMLQAKTALSRASLRVTRIQGSLEQVLGDMALLMGQSADLPLRVETHSAPQPDLSFVVALDELLAIAQQTHPTLRAAQARLSAAQSAVQESRAYGRPNVALTASINRSRSMQPPALGSDFRQSDSSLGLLLNIPLFDGMEREYRIRDAQARTAESTAAMEDTLQRISRDVWLNYQTLKTETESLQRTSEIEDQSRQALEVVRGRYRAGVGNMTELLNAMNAFTDAQELHISTLNSWRISRIGLAGSLGRLGFWSLD